MPPLIDITGEKYGRLTVLERDSTKKGKYVYWLCQCDCGTVKSIRGTALKSGLTKSCGCLSIEKNKSNFEIKKYGKLTPLEVVKTEDNNHKFWRCQCDCGNIIIVRQDFLLSGHTKSCGCIKSLGEYKIIQILKDNGIEFKTQYTFEDLKNKKKLKFDFAIFSKGKLVCLIEYQGEQHYHSGKGWNTPEKFEKQQMNDNIKRDYCLKNNIKLVEIPYYDLSQLSWEYFKTMFDFI